MKKREISAIDSIYEVLDRIKNIEKHYELLNKQNAIINNKLNKIIELIDFADDKILEESAKPFASSSLKAEAKPIIKEEVKESEEEGSFVIGKIKVFSRLLTPSRTPIPDVNIKIFNFQNKIIRNLLSDKDGYWECRIPPGRYRLTMDHSNFKTIEKDLELGNNIKSYEVL